MNAPEAAPYRPSLGECATLACLLEVTAAKPGNVHRGADFEDVNYLDFLLSAQAIGPVFDRADELRLGEIVHGAVAATRRRVANNTNLGLILLLAPLAQAASFAPDWSTGLSGVWNRLTPADAAEVYEAIRLAKPGGLGKVPESDIAAPSPADLIAAMKLAADRDLIARQYATNFSTVLHEVVPNIVRQLTAGRGLQTATIDAFLRLMAGHPDSLIGRKCGPHLAEQAAGYAQTVLRAGEPGSEAYLEALADLDYWLRADGHRRNPGTSADLVGAALFVVLWQGLVPWPLRFYD